MESLGEAGHVAEAEKRVLVTGASGFVGRHLISALTEAFGPTVSIIRAGHEGEADVCFDLTDRAAVFAAVAGANPDIVIHLAGEASVAKATEAAAKAWKVNAFGALELALATAAVNPGATFFFTSSAEVYGEAFLDGPVTEATRPAPVSVYGQSKLAAEQMLTAVLPETATLLIVRPANHVGPGQDFRFALPSFAGQLVKAERANSDAVIRVGNLTTERDFTDVRDVVQSYIRLIDRYMGSAAKETFNVASERVVSVGSMLDGLRDVALVKSEVIVDPERARPAEISRASIDCAKIRNAVGWEPKISRRESLQDIMDYARTNLPI